MKKSRKIGAVFAAGIATLAIGAGINSGAAQAQGPIIGGGGGGEILDGADNACDPFSADPYFDWPGATEFSTPSPIFTKIADTECQIFPPVHESKFTSEIPIPGDDYGYGVMNRFNLPDWVISDAKGKPILRKRENRLVFQADGNLVLYNAKGAVLWESLTSEPGHPTDSGRKLRFTERGNLYIVDTDGKKVDVTSLTRQPQSPPQFQ